MWKLLKKPKFKCVRTSKEAINRRKYTVKITRVTDRIGEGGNAKTNDLAHANSARETVEIDV